MGKVDYRRLPPRQREDLEQELWSTIEVVAKQGALLPLLADLLTPSEQVMLARRVQIAKMLLAGLSHSEIASRLNVGLTTVYAVDRWLRRTDTYRRVLPALSAEALQHRR